MTDTHSGSGSATAASSDSSGSDGPRIRFRPDIEGLRAVAISLVVLDHLNVPGFSGRGFIGVDVFFVISGFLITSLLATERGRSVAAVGSGRRSGISLGAFYLRRARRILPAALTVIAATLIAAKLSFNVVRYEEVKADAFWATIFAANLQLMHQATDYFATGLAVSPLQNYWSLAVEEQFYLVWPLLMIATSLLWASGTQRLKALAGFEWRTLALGAIALLFAVSLAWSIIECSANPAASYFSPLTRAWELAMGAMLALWLSERSGAGGRLASLCGVLGLGLIGLGLVLVGPDVPYPGAVALIPTVGTALLIASGARSGVTAPSITLLSLRPVRWLGRVSYSLYLWHWPIIVFAATLVSTRTLSGASRAIVLGAVSVAAAALSYRLIETPFRKLPLRKGDRVAAGAKRGSSAGRRAAMAVFAGAVVLTIVVLARPDGGGSVARPANIDAILANWPVQLKAATDVRSVSNSSLQLAGEGKKLGPQNCWDSINPSVVRSCTIAGSDSTGRIVWPAGASSDVVLFGNSYAAQWRQTIAGMLPRGVRVIPLTVTGCDPADLKTHHINAAGIDCGKAMRSAVSRIAEIRPALVVFSTTQGADAIRTAGLLKGIGRSANHVVWIGFTPATQRFDRCLGDGTNVTACNLKGAAYPWAAGYDRSFRAAATAVGAGYADLLDVFCVDSVCPAFVGGLPIRTDGSHLTDFAMRAAAPTIERSISRELRPSDGISSRPDPAQAR